MMRQAQHHLATIVSLIITSVAAAGEPAKVPLSEVWAYRMPGTKDVHGLELGPFDSKHFVGWGYEEFSRMREDAITNIVLALHRKIPSEQAAKGFVVAWQGDAIALRNMSNNLMAALHDKPILGRVKDDAPATLLFFSYPSSYYVQLTDIERDDKVVTVSYQFVPHKTVESTVHFALVPLGTLPAGEYQVRYEQTPMDGKFHDDGFVRPSTQQVRRLICQSFTFNVLQAKRTPVDESGAELPLEKIWALTMPGTRDVRELDPRESAEDTMISKIGRVLTVRSGERAMAGPCFLVKGEGREALENATRVLVDGESPIDSDSVPADADLTLVFYSYAAPGYVHLHSVRRSPEHLAINYQVAVHHTSEMTVHFALIPLGKISAGRFTVDVVEVDSGGPDSDPAVKERAICDSCSFVVQEGGTQQ